MIHTKRPALTLLELTVVLVILVGLAGMLVPLIRTTGDDARVTTTRATMKNLRDALLTYFQDMKGVTVVKAAGDVTGPADASNATGIPYSLRDLQFAPAVAAGEPASFDPVTKRGWRGPYLASSTAKFDFAKLDASFSGYGNPGDPGFIDGWGQPIVLQWPASGEGGSTAIADRAKYVRLVSAGNKSATGAYAIDTDVSQWADVRGSGGGKDLVLFLRVQDKNP